MIQLDIDDEEREILAGVLTSYLSDLRMEISHTDSQDVREMLKHRKAVLQKVLASLGAGQMGERLDPPRNG